MNLIMRRDGAAILKVVAIKVGNAANILTAIERKETKFLDVKKALLSYTGAFQLQ